MKARKRKLSEKLGGYVRLRYNTAKDAKSELYETLLKCVDLATGKSTPDADGVCIDVNIVRPILRGVKGMIRDILASTNEKPYTVIATPLPELPQDVERKLGRELEKILPELLTMVPPEEMQPALQKMRNTALLYANKEAAKAARKMEEVVNDDMTEGGWGDAFDQFIYNFVNFPLGILKAPSLQVKWVKKWVDNRLIAEREVVRACENISPFNLFWAPNAPSIQAAEYLIERRRIGADELIALISEDTYDSEAIDYILDQLPDGHIEPYENGSDSPPELDDETSGATGETSGLNGMYDTLGFYGKVKGSTLKDFDIDVEDERDWYEAVVWTINDIVYSVTLNPDPAGARPFHVAAYDAIPGQIYGSCPSLDLEDTQRVCIATVRALVRNMALALGVIGEVESGRLADDDDPRIMYANMLRLVKPVRGAATTTAYHFHNVPSHAQELMGVFDKFLAMGYELLGIPRIAFGSTDGLGTIGRTAGGIAAVMNQASKTIKDALRTIEYRVIEPVVQSYIDWNLLFNPDQNIKGDVKAHARGVSGVLEREAQRDKLSWALQSIVPLTQAPGPDGQPLIPQEAVLRLLYSLFQANGIPTDGVLPNFDEQEAAMADVLGQGTINPTTQNVPQLGGNEVQLDGRSATAANAISEMNSLG